MPRRQLTRAALALLVALTASCTSDAEPAADPAAYRSELASICTASSAERSALPYPVDAAGVADFARAVAGVLTREADAARALRAPDDLDSDHRAFVQNTADQAARWTSLATTPADDTDQFGALQTDILQLTLGRDDLATAMAIPSCRITPG
jgi:hypothetical protein